jgi:sprouty-related EVH1 domain-containing protein
MNFETLYFNELSFYYLFFSGNSVVRVRAQVMMRDDSTGGWLPMGGGGLSNVSVRKRRVQHEDDQPCKHEYLIHGKRISDQAVSDKRWFADK